jgi:hypothetical protein
MLREFIAFTRKFPRVWYATGREVAEAWIVSGEIEKQKHVKIG